MLLLPHSLETRLLPELRQFEGPHQACALDAARRTPLDALELIGMAAALILVTALTRYTFADAGLLSRTALALLNFVAAVPLLAIGLAPFHLRRLRRGLRAQLDRDPATRVGSAG